MFSKRVRGAATKINLNNTEKQSKTFFLLILITIITGLTAAETTESWSTQSDYENPEVNQLTGFYEDDFGTGGALTLGYDRDRPTDGVSSNLNYYYRFTEGTGAGTTVNDFHGSNDGTIVDGLDSGVGIFERDTYFFDKNNGHVETPVVDTSGDHTVSFWMRWDGSTEDFDVMYTHTDDDFNNGVEIMVDNRLTPVIRAVFREGGAQIELVKEEEIFEGIWYHVAIVDSGNAVQLYVDGEVKDGEAISYDASPNTNPFIGDSYVEDLSGFNGEIDEFIHFDTDIEPSELNDLNNQGTREVQRTFTEEKEITELEIDHDTPSDSDLKVEVTNGDESIVVDPGSGSSGIDSSTGSITGTSFDFIYDFTSTGSVASINSAARLLTTSYTYEGAGDTSNPGNQVWTYTEHTATIWEVATDSDGNVFSGSSDNTVHKINPDGTQEWIYEQHTSTVWSVATDTDGNIYTGSIDNTVHRVTPDGVTEWIYEEHTGSVNGLATDTAGNIYSGSSDNTVHKINPDGTTEWIYEQTGNVRAIATDNDGNIYSASTADTVHKINPDGTQEWIYNEHTDDVTSVTTDTDGNIYAGSIDNTLHKISPDGTQEWVYEEHTDYVFGLATDSDNNIYSGAGDQTLHKINRDGTTEWEYTEHTDTVYGVAVDNNGHVYSASVDEEVHKIESGESLNEPADFGGEPLDDFFDGKYEDRDDSSYPEWNDVNSNVDIVSSPALESGYSAEFNMEADSENSLLRIDRGTGTTVEDGDIYSAALRWEDEHHFSNALFLSNSDSDNVYGGENTIKLGNSDEEWRFRTDDSNGGTIEQVETGNIELDKWYIVEIHTFPGQGEAEFYVYDEDYELEVSETLSASSETSIRYLGSQFYDSDTATGYVDLLSYDSVEDHPYGNEPPVFNSVSTTPDDWIVDESVDFSYEVSDSDGTVEEVTLEVFRDGSLEKEETFAYGTENVEDTQFDWYTPTESGSYTVDFTATDDDGAETVETLEKAIDDPDPIGVVFIEPSEPGETYLEGFEWSFEVEVETTSSDIEAIQWEILENGNAVYQDTIETSQGTNTIESYTLHSTEESSITNEQINEMTGTFDLEFTAFRENDQEQFTETTTYNNEIPETGTETYINPVDGDTITEGTTFDYELEIETSNMGVELVEYTVFDSDTNSIYEFEFTDFQEPNTIENYVASSSESSILEEIGQYSWVAVVTYEDGTTEQVDFPQEYEIVEQQNIDIITPIDGGEYNQLSLDTEVDFIQLENYGYTIHIEDTEQDIHQIDGGTISSNDETINNIVDIPGDIVDEQGDYSFIADASESETPVARQGDLYEEVEFVYSEDLNANLFNPEQDEVFNVDFGETADITFEWNVITPEDDTQVELVLDDDVVFTEVVDTGTHSFSETLTDIQPGTYDWNVDLSSTTDVVSSETRSFEVVESDALPPEIELFEVNPSNILLDELFEVTYVANDPDIQGINLVEVELFKSTELLQEDLITSISTDYDSVEVEDVVNRNDFEQSLEQDEELFPEIGTYTLRLTVQNEAGETSTQTTTIQYNERTFIGNLISPFEKIWEDFIEETTATGKVIAATLIIIGLSGAGFIMARETGAKTGAGTGFILTTVSGLIPGAIVVAMMFAVGAWFLFGRNGGG